MKFIILALALATSAATAKAASCPSLCSGDQLSKKSQDLLIESFRVNLHFRSRYLFSQNGIPGCAMKEHTPNLEVLRCIPGNDFGRAESMNFAQTMNDYMAKRAKKGCYPEILRNDTVLRAYSERGGAPNYDAYTGKFLHVTLAQFSQSLVADMSATYCQRR